MEWLIDADRQLLLLINGWNCPFFDVFMWIVSSTSIWIPFFAAFLFLVIKEKRREAWLVLLLAVLTVVLTDQISSSLIKPLVARFRPTHDSVIGSLVHVVNGYRGGRFGFVSSHAANTFGFALFSSLVLRHRPYTCTAFLWASLSSYSRMYLGVHFPLDILGGLAVGLLCGGLMYVLLVRLQSAVFHRSLADRIGRSQPPFTGSGFSRKSADFPVFAFAVTILFIVLVCLRIKSI